MLAPYPVEVEVEAWNPKVVKACMVEAFRTLRRIPGRIGPKQPGSGWPAIVREMGEEYSFRSGDTEYQRPLSTAQIGLMEEVLGWPARFLSDFPKGGDALNLWALCKAWRFNMKGILEQRAGEAKTIASVVEREINERRAGERMAAAGEVAEWANRRLGSAFNRERMERIRANAFIRLERDLAKKDLVQARIWVKPADVFADKVISETDMREKRDHAARMIADQLARSR